MSDNETLYDIKMQNIDRYEYSQSTASLTTQYLTTLPIIDRRYGNNLTIDCEQMILCNAIGFKQYNPLEISIAHQKSMTEVLSYANSILLMVIISYNSFTTNKMNDIISLGEHLNAFKDANNFNHIIFLFKAPSCKQK